MSFAFKEHHIVYQKGPYWALMAMMLPISIPLILISFFQLLEFFKPDLDSSASVPITASLLIFALMTFLVWIHGMLLRRQIYNFNFGKQMLTIKNRSLTFKHSERCTCFNQIECLEATKYGDADKEGPFYKLLIKTKDKNDILLHHRLAYVSPGEVKAVDRFFAALPCKIVYRERNDKTRINRHLDAKKAALNKG